MGAPRLAERDVHVWIVGSETGSVHVPASTREGARDRSHALLRSLLGAYLRVEAASLRFELGEHGKPRLPQAGQPAAVADRLRFNLSHSGGVTAVAISRYCEVGIDVELPGRRRDYLALSRRAFGEPTAARLRRLGRDDREREFLRLWVRHEAALKCRGGRLSLGGTGRLQAPPWTTELELAGAPVAALACARRPARVRLTTAP
jgi:4'-phosphopantetheinyl transferase